MGFPGRLGEEQAQVQVVFMGSSWFLQVWLASLSFFTSGFFPACQPCWPTAKLCPPQSQAPHGTKFEPHRVSDVGGHQLKTSVLTEEHLGLWTSVIYVY